MAFRATFLAVVALTLGGHLAALGFEMAMAARFGTGLDADALAFALVLVFAVAAEIAGWVSTLFIPLYIDARAASPGGALAFFRRAGIALAVMAAAVATIVAAGAPGLVGLLAPALGSRGVAVLRAFAPLAVLAPVGALFAATLHAHGRFVAPSLRQLAWHGGGLVGVVGLAGALGVVGVPLGMVATMLAFAVLMAVLAAREVGGGGPQVSGGPDFGRIGRLFVPLALLSVLNAVNIAVERAIAARLPEGSLAALTYGYRLLHFPLTLFLVNATAMLLPTLAGHAARGEGGALDDLARRAFRLAVVFAVPVAALALALAEPLTRVLLERGAFTAASTAATATAIAWYAPGIAANAAGQVLFRTFQARHAVWRLAGTAGAAIVLNVVLMATLTPLLGFRGLPLAASLSAFALVVFMLVGLRSAMPALSAGLGRFVAALFTAGIASGAAAWLARALAGGDAAPALVAGLIAGGGVYAAALAALAPGEARAVLALLTPARDARPA